MADTTPRQPRYVELLPPEGSKAQQPAPQTNNRLPATAGDDWLTVPLIQRVLDKIAAKNARARGDRVVAENEIVALLTERLRLLEQFARQLGRFEALPLLRSAETIQVYAEVEQTIDDINHERQMRRIRQERELTQAQRELDDLKRDPLPALPAPSKEPPRRRLRADRIRAIRKECEDTITLLREGRTDDELDTETRQIIDDCRYHANRRIKAILEED